jgi:Malic enzyme, NAD binding domain
MMSATCAGMQRQGLTADEACKNFWIADYNGLITVEREDLSGAVAPFARLPDAGDSEGEALADIVRRVSASLSQHHICRCGSARR